MEEASKLEIGKISPTGFALGNIICLAGNDENGLNYALYVRVVTLLSQDFLRWIERRRPSSTENHLSFSGMETVVSNETQEDERANHLNLMYMDLLKPVYQQRHHMNLLSKIGSGDFIREDASAENLQLIDVVYFYCSMLKIFSMMNQGAGSLPILNILSFTSGFLGRLWDAIEGFTFPVEDNHRQNIILVNSKSGPSQNKSKVTSKSGGAKWASVLQKITGKAQSDSGALSSTGSEIILDQASASYIKNWDVERLRRGPHGIPQDLSSFLHLFCASYSHLLLILEDEEFYEKQVSPFCLTCSSFLPLSSMLIMTGSWLLIVSINVSFILISPFVF